MAIPSPEKLAPPLLALLADGEEHRVEGLRVELARQFALTDEELDERTPSGKQNVFVNHVAWALVQLGQASLVEKLRTGVYRSTDLGLQGSAHVHATDGAPVVASVHTNLGAASDTPEERIEAAAQEIRRALATELLDRVLGQTPGFFEQVVLDVLQAIGYGGSRQDAAERLGRASDGGVDGVIREDKLGLDLIYVQAKRWANPVGRPEIQKFVGALTGQNATKGVFITTSTFTHEAREYAETSTPRVVLVDGRQLAELMIDHDVGVSVEATYPIRRIDLDYFGVEDTDSPVSAEPPEAQWDARDPEAPGA